MARATVNALVDGTDPVELEIGYEILGDSGRPWVITPGGRFGRNYPGVREFGQALADLGNRVMVWDRPNCGDSDVCFVGSTESAMQSDVLGALLHQLDFFPAVIAGGSGGSRLALMTTARHREVAQGIAGWWITGGAHGLMSLADTYNGASLRAAWNDGMQGVIDLPESAMYNWQENLALNPRNRQLFLDLDPKEFIRTLERWMLTFYPRDDELIPGLPNDEVRKLDLPSLVLLSGESDPNHTRITSRQLAELLPNCRLVEPPWPDRVWVDSKTGRRCDSWYQIAPVLDDWANEVLPKA
jgi:pimeloyl-ACP methyl ester carboxylesterase